MGVLAKKSTFLKLYAFCHSFHSKKHKIIWKPCKQLICIIYSAKLKFFLVHFVIAIDYGEKTSVLLSIETGSSQSTSNGYSFLRLVSPEPVRGSNERYLSAQSNYVTKSVGSGGAQQLLASIVHIRDIFGKNEVTFQQLQDF